MRPMLFHLKIYTLKNISDDYQVELANTLYEHPGPVAVSGYRSPLMDKWYDGWKRIDHIPKLVTGDGSCNKKPKRIESLWVNYDKIGMQKAFI